MTRLLVEVSADDRAKQNLLAAIPRTLGAGWRVTSLFPATAGDTACADLARFFVLTSQAPTAELYGVSQNPWDLSYALAAEPDAALSVVPDLAHRAFGQETFVPGDIRTASDLPGSDAHDWALAQMHCREAWALPIPPGRSARGQGILIGHPDTGYTLHPELQDALDLADDWNVIDNDADARDPLIRILPLDTPGHGTSTASVMASREIGEIFGAAPEVTVVPIRCIRSVVNVFDSNVARAVDHGRRARCSIISMSLGGGLFQGLEAAINCAVSQGVLVMAAAGNYSPWVVWPAMYENCIAVAASNADRRPWQFSSHGNKVAVSAPGESVWAAGFNLDTPPPTAVVGRGSGTSYAVAHLAGVASLWVAYHGKKSLLDRYGPARLQPAFLEVVRTAGFARPPDWDTNEFGVGIVDAKALLEAALPQANVLRPVAAATPAPRDPIDLIKHVCPELTYEEVRARLADVLGPDAKGIATHGWELLYLLTEHKDVRAAFVGEPAQVAATGVRMPASTRDALAGVASRSLRSALRRTDGVTGSAKRSR